MERFWEIEERIWVIFKEIGKLRFLDFSSKRKKLLTEGCFIISMQKFIWKQTNYKLLMKLAEQEIRGYWRFEQQWENLAAFPRISYSKYFMISLNLNFRF
ncbi:unnamed protein product [Blepharisma stoltei]|uniref:Uncharacterized protein n=1 Tax=Blepharisma stoltei TaxID=1481888 RepID=A0AAU9I912_9CILI|nr:unnamed protein product [Blepharisma stoltei]